MAQADIPEPGKSVNVLLPACLEQKSAFTFYPDKGIFLIRGMKQRMNQMGVVRALIFSISITLVVINSPIQNLRFYNNWRPKNRSGTGFPRRAVRRSSPEAGVPFVCSVFRAQQTPIVAGCFLQIFFRG
jgi:hypothetical protein